MRKVNNVPPSPTQMVVNTLCCAKPRINASTWKESICCERATGKVSMYLHPLRIG